MAELKIGLDDLMGAMKNITFGIANSNNDFVRTYFDPQSGRNYQVLVRACGGERERGCGIIVQNNRLLLPRWKQWYRSLVL